MSEKLETVEIKGQDGNPLLINSCDYDKETHELFDAPEKVVKDKFDREDAFALLEEKGVKVVKNISNIKLEEAVLALETKSDALLIEEKDGKFFIGNDAYDTKEAAETMLELLAGK